VETSGTTSYGWDFENRLTSVTLPNSGGTVSFKYDPFGRRIQKASTAATTNYIYDGANIVAEYDGSGSLIARYAQGQGIDQPLAITKQGSTAYYNADGLGSITTLRDAGGALVASYSYEAFGKTTSTGSLVNPFQYTGRESDQETGLYYYRARYYDSQTGRFTSEDPVYFYGGLNFFSYVRNNPLVWTDPQGWGTISCIQWLWYYRKCAKNIPDCRKKLESKDQVDALTDANTGFMSCALLKECGAKNPDCQKAVKYGVKCGAWAQPTPVPDIPTSLSKTTK
jgi:RHS repeat-associated protein